jgi:TonB family protein
MRALLRLKGAAFCLLLVCSPGLMAKQDPSSMEPSKTSQTASTAQAAMPHRIHVQEAVEKAKLIHTVSPIYPMLSELPGVGTVVLHVVVGKNGAVKSARYASGPTNLMNSAIKAVLQWRYKPTLVNGVAFEVETTVTVVFAPLSEQEPQETTK